MKGRKSSQGIESHLGEPPKSPEPVYLEEGVRVHRTSDHYEQELPRRRERNSLGKPAQMELLESDTDTSEDYVDPKSKSRQVILRNTGKFDMILR